MFACLAYVAHDFEGESQTEYGVVCRANFAVKLCVQPAYAMEKFSNHLFRLSPVVSPALPSNG